MNGGRFSRRALVLGGLAWIATGCASGGWQATYRLDPRYMRQRVRYPSSEKAGTLVVNTSERFLYVVEDNRWATRYGVAVGEEGLTLKGRATVDRKAEWPSTGVFV